MHATEQRKGTRLLLVGSEAELGRFAAGALEGRGFRVAHAVGSEQALTLIRDFRPQAAVLDIGSDTGSALSLLARIRAADPSLPVILLAEEGNADAAMYGFELGAADILGKPADVDHLANRMRTAIAGPASAPREKTIADLMVPASAYQRVYEDDSVQRVIEVLTQSLFQSPAGEVTEQGHRTVLVYSRAEEFLGCIRVNDALELLTPPPGRHSSSPCQVGMFMARCKLFGSITAGEMMGEQRFVDVSAPLMEAAELMAVDNSINIPVLREGELVGMLTDRNLLLEMCSLATGETLRWTGARSAAALRSARSARAGRRRRARRTVLCS
jgi:DNA-binding response OmpR family regulator